MHNIILFIPKAEADATSNLATFIEICRSQLTVFGKDLVFDSNSWDISDVVRFKADRKIARLVFSSWESSGRRGKSFLAEPFLRFAKGYLRYQYGLRPSKTVSAKLTALRALEHALIELHGGANIINVTPATFNRAAQLLTERSGEFAAYKYGCHLETLARFLSDGRLSKIPFQWRNPISPHHSVVRVGKKFDEQRREKLPSRAALEAIPKMFRVALEPGDVIATSVLAILCSAPDRINEVLLLPENCWVDGSYKGALGCGLRWWPAKGAEPLIKWIVPSMTSVVRDAVSKIKLITEAGRKVARWYEANPDKLYLTDQWEHLRIQPFLTMSEVACVLYGFNTTAGRSDARQWCIYKEVSFGKCGRKLTVSFSDLQNAVLKMLPIGFPMVHEEVGLSYSESLFAVQYHECSAKFRTIVCAIECVDYPKIRDMLGGRVMHGVSSTFSRLGFFEDDGSPIRLPTHQLRHYLNTLAQKGGMSQLDIAKWSGRSDVRQNSAYDHVSAREMLEMIRSSVGDEKRAVGPLSSIPKAELISRDEFVLRKIPTAHTTDFGYCIHDFTMSPCELHRDCLNCQELVCVKGELQKAENLLRRQHELRTLLKSAVEAEKKGYAGASRWVEHHSVTLNRIDQLAEILNDPKVPINACVQVTLAADNKPLVGLGQ